MKTRNGFISNSSSSSFVITKHVLSPLQIELIKDHTKHAQEFGIDYADCPWRIEETDSIIEGHTSMDNFDMETFLRRIGVNMTAVEWNSY